MMKEEMMPEMAREYEPIAKRSDLLRRGAKIEAQAPALRPRKLPRQRRAEMTVDALLIASERVLMAGGFTALSTNRIAEVAGVSVGSLYQYFPNKEAILAALFERYVSRDFQHFVQLTETISDLPFDKACRRLLEEMLTIYCANAPVRQTLLGQMTAIGCKEVLDDMFLRYRECLSAFLATHAGELTVTDPESTSFVLFHAIEAVLRQTAFRADDEEFRSAVIGNLMNLILSLVKKS